MDANKTPVPIVKAVIETTGIKPAKSYIHDIIRVLIIIGIAALVYVSTQQINETSISLDDVSEVIKPGTIMHQSIQEMDEDTQVRYLKSLKKALDDDDVPVSKKYLKSMQVSLIAGIVSEYVTNGNLAKPMGIIAKTIMYSSISTMASL